MLQGLAAACGGSDTGVGLNFDGGLQIGDSVADVRVVRRPKQDAPGGSFLQRVEQAVQVAVHPDSVPLTGGDGDGSQGANVIPFPVVSPYRPLTATRVPVAGLTAFPKRGYPFNGESNADFNPGGYDPNDRVPPGHESLGFLDPVGSAPIGIGLNDYSPLGMKWEGIIGQITQTTPAIISAVRGNPYYDPSQNFNPQLTPPYESTRSAGQAPEGYYYDDRGTLRQIGSNVGGAVGSIGQSLSDFVQRNPLLVLGGGAALVLLFMSPPRRR